MSKEIDEYYANEIKKIQLLGKDRYKQEPFIRNIKMKRNEKCPCGSGLKYKRCCMPKEL